MIYAAIMGHGVVGSGAAEILEESRTQIGEKIKDDLVLKYILDLRDFPDTPYHEKFTKDFSAILNDPDVKIVAEAMGGLHPAYDFVKQCLLAGKSVVTSNKELVAAKGYELLKIAAEKNVNFLFEASVGGGIPILRPMAQCLSANRIDDVIGILNGTTNYILDKMVVDSMSFDDALKLAQDNGFAEKNPAADIEGHDACRKICILAALAFGKHVYPEQVKTEGITAITAEDVEYAETFNAVIKLIARAKRNADGTVSAYVRPTVIPRDNILANVNGVNNAVTVIGDRTGAVLFYGKGAGKFPTASAVVADMMDCAKHLAARKYLGWEDGYDGYITDSNEPERFYVTAHADDFCKLCDEITTAFPEEMPIVKSSTSGTVTFLTPPLSEQRLNETVGKLSADSIKIFHTLF